MACVGHASMQRVQLPQRSAAGVSAGSSSEVRITPRNSHDPIFWWMMQVFLPIHPIPAYLA